MEKTLNMQLKKSYLPSRQDQPLIDEQYSENPEAKLRIYPDQTKHFRL